MIVTPAYIPGPAGLAAAQARAAVLGVGVAPTNVPPVYQPYVTTLPGVIAEGGGTIVYLPDNGSVVAADVANLIAPLTAAAAGAAAQAANQATINTNLLARQTQIQAWVAANPSGAILTAGQTLTLAQMLNGLCKLLLQQYTNTTGT